MSSQSPQHTEWILETIDHLRKRKARPDLQRICHVVRRKFGLPNVVTENKLEKLVDAEVVIKVDYKGSTSYRNASKWRKSMIGCAVQNSTTVSTKIIEAILVLSKTKLNIEHAKDHVSPGGNKNKDTLPCTKVSEDEVGVTLEEIEAWLTKNCDGFVNLKSPLNIVLKREIDAGRIEKIDKNGRFVISSAQKDELKSDAIKLLDASKKTDSKCNVSHDSSDKKETKQLNVTVIKTTLPKTGTSLSGKRDIVIHQPSRRGRPPKFRPPEDSDSHSHAFKTSKLKRSRSSGDEGSSSQSKVTRKSLSSAHDECKLCNNYRSSEYGGKGQGETLLHCKDCSIKAHPSCLNYNPVLASRAAKGPWQCMDCKTCCVCHDSGEGDLMLFCDGCDKGYHMKCHLPHVTKKPSGLWECYDCRLENSTLERNEFAAMHIYHNGGLKDSAPPTPSESPVPSSHPDDQQVSDFPDASKWTTDEVADYFQSAGFPNEAQVFKDQEIDGVALLLLKRVDVLKELDFKLGPALKLNRLIQGFQTARM